MIRVLLGAARRPCVGRPCPPLLSSSSFFCAACVVHAWLSLQASKEKEMKFYARLLPSSVLHDPIFHVHAQRMQLKLCGVSERMKVVFARWLGAWVNSATRARSRREWRRGSSSSQTRMKRIDEGGSTADALGDGRCSRRAAVNGLWRGFWLERSRAACRRTERRQRACEANVLALPSCQHAWCFSRACSARDSLGSCLTVGCCKRDDAAFRGRHDADGSREHPASGDAAACSSARENPSGRCVVG